MRRVFVLVLGVVCVFESLIVVAQTRSLIPEEETAYASGSQNAPGHVKLLDERKADLASAFNLYNYDWTKAWFPRELHSPLIKKNAIFMFENVPAPLSEDFERLTVVIPLSGRDIRIIPLSYGMLGPAYVKEDPHNIAIFNEVVSRERPSIRTATDRLNLAVLYLHLFQKDPMVLDENNLDAFVGVHRKTSTGLLPRVVTKSDGRFSVELVQKEGICGPFMKIRFSFDKQDIMRAFDENKIPESELTTHPDSRC